MTTAQRRQLADGRWHFQHGPIDCVITAEGETGAVSDAIERAWQRFAGLLDELMREVSVLRLDLSTAKAASVQGRVAARMVRACFPHAADGHFITAMAAVAGSVADELIGFFESPAITRAAVNNGGDIALHLSAEAGAAAAFAIGLIGNIDAALHDVAAGDTGSISAPHGAIEPDAVVDPPSATTRSARLDARFRIDAASPVRGIATSGWRGRSFSLGIADSVTVLARHAADADAAATVIANAVDLDDARIERAPASSRRDDSDLGERLVVLDVPVLSLRQITQALDAGARQADHEIAAGRIIAAVLYLQGRFRVCGLPDPRDSSAPTAAATTASPSPALASAPPFDDKAPLASLHRESFT